MFDMMMPKGAKNLTLSKMNMGGIGSMMMKWVMKNKKYFYSFRIDYTSTKEWN